MRRARRLAEPALTKSDREEEFLALCRAALLSSPEVNTALVIDDGPPIEVDFLWRAQRLAVETDAFGTHGMRHSFERDRRRDQRVKLAGDDSLRFTRRQVLKSRTALSRPSARCSRGPAQPSRARALRHACGPRRLASTPTTRSAAERSQVI
ncbi:MAG TPA: hypothetical protein VHF45_04575 [Thermoleophilaceae bacterium]|nr:hypothetical protein [Thermoleophilaceae bacterium]